MDIVERLWIDRETGDPLLYGERKEAAKEIERLREALKEVSCSCTDENCCMYGSHCLPNIARLALKETK